MTDDQKAQKAAEAATSDAANFTATAIKAQMEKEAQEAAKKKEQEKKGKSPEKEDKTKVAALKAFVERGKVAQKQKEKDDKEAEEIKKKEVFAKIGNYMTRFPFLADRVPRVQPRSSLGEAEEILRLIHEAMNSVGSLNTLANYVNEGFSAIEHFWGDGSSMTWLPPKNRLNLSGIGKLFREGKFPELDPLIVEIDTEYPWIGRRSLIWRCLQTLGELALKVHAFNVDPNARKIFDMKRAPAVEVQGSESL